eukprot:scaffold4256_cov174-Ochromonas_danica.AAC.6
MHNQYSACAHATQPLQVARLHLQNSQLHELPAAFTTSSSLPTSSDHTASSDSMDESDGNGHEEANDDQDQEEEDEDEEEENESNADNDEDNDDDDDDDDVEDDDDNEHNDHHPSKQSGQDNSHNQGLSSISLPSSFLDVCGNNTDGTSISTPGKFQANDPSRTMECMICGKLFPRGPIDLQRHATAITLKHLVSNKAASGYPFGCNKCGLHFTTSEHLQMHRTMSTCNPENVWPENAATTSGLRAVKRGQQVTSIDNSKNADSTTGNANTKDGKSNKIVVVKSEHSSHEVSSSSSPAIGLITRKRDRESLASSVVEESNNSSNSGIGHGGGAPSSLLTNSNSVFMQHGGGHSTGEIGTRNKRAKVIIPEERKAFFSVVSLLIDPKTVDQGIKLTEQNYEQYLPAEHLPIVQKLKGYVITSSSSLSPPYFLFIDNVEDMVVEMFRERLSDTALWSSDRESEFGATMKKEKIVLTSGSLDVKSLSLFLFTSRLSLLCMI